jgi:hypothetical protein
VSGCSPATGRDPLPVPVVSVTASEGEPGSAGLAGGHGSPTAPPGPPSPSASAALPDGRSASYIKSVDVGARTVTFDLIVLLEGDAATKEWVKTHPDEPDGPPEGYLITNDNTRLRTVPLSPQVIVKVIDLNAADPSARKPIKLANLPKHLAAERNAGLPYWLTVEHGQVTLMEEQYLA